MIEKQLKILFILVLCVYFNRVSAQGVSFLVMGDIHLDKFELHDMDYVNTRPQDFAQISKEYPFFTATFTPHLFARAKQQVATFNPPVKAVVQLGDLMQGVAGNDKLSRDMARFSIDYLYDTDLGTPWILAKGNHDVSTSPGQPEAWKEVVLPFIERQTGKELTNGMYTYQLSDDVHFFILEQFFSPDQNLPETEILNFLKQELPESKAKFKFLVTHQPVIPVTERCWHLFSGIRRELKDEHLRTEFLELLAEHQVTVLCAHLHKYSKIERKTNKGTVRQFMFNSVIQGFKEATVVSGTTVFPGTQTIDKSWQPHTLERRLKILKNEVPHIKSYYSENSSGYAIFSLHGNRVELNYFRGYGNNPSDKEIFYIN
ncbi:MAG: metallophosphoesterase [Proteiniphilum sp.]|jgi:hypothetical protein|nr:metallophosphoesterase [Proteiniphilum sp.]